MYFWSFTESPCPSGGGMGGGPFGSAGYFAGDDAEAAGAAAGDAGAGLGSVPVGPGTLATKLGPQRGSATPKTTSAVTELRRRSFDIGGTLPRDAGWT